jgi:hypothetical protein
MLSKFQKKNNKNLINKQLWNISVQKRNICEKAAETEEIYKIRKLATGNYHKET